MQTDKSILSEINWSFSSIIHEMNWDSRLVFSQLLVCFKKIFIFIFYGAVA